jgi:hypothetical protein
MEAINNSLLIQVDENSTGDDNVPLGHLHELGYSSSFRCLKVGAVDHMEGRPENWLEVQTIYKDGGWLIVAISSALKLDHWFQNAFRALF